MNLHPEVSCEIILNVARSLEEASKQKQIGKAVTSNAENEDLKEEVIEELSEQKEPKSDEKKVESSQTDDLNIEEVEIEETKKSSEQN